MTACCCSNMSRMTACSAPGPGRISARGSAQLHDAHRRAPMAGRSIMRSARSRSTIARAATGRASGASRGWSPPRACSTGPGASGSSGWRGGSATCFPPRRRAALLHGDLWTGNILVRDGRLVALIDPACYYGHAEVDLAMLCLFCDAARGILARPMARASRAGRSGCRSTSSSPRSCTCACSGPAYAPMVDRLLDAQPAPSRADSARRSNRPPPRR